MPTPGLEVLITDLYSLSLSIQDGNPVVNIDTKKNKLVLTTGFQSCILKSESLKPSLDPISQLSTHILYSYVCIILVLYNYIIIYLYTRVLIFTATFDYPAEFFLFFGNIIKTPCAKF